ncbi:MAG: helix-turn-helix transcriptional regulator [Propionicimonas sp.]
MIPPNLVYPVFDSQIELAMRFLSQQVSVVFTGIRGSGRSMILGRVADRLRDEGRNVLRLEGIGAWRDEPFGALMSLSGEIDISRRSLHEVTTVLERYVIKRAPVVVCDDADDLDLQSAGALLAVQRRAGFVALLSRRAASDTAAAGITRAVRIPVPSLGLSQLSDLAAELLGGPVETRTLSRIAAASGGLYGITHAILTVTRLSGQLVQSPSGQWILSGELWSDLFAGTLAPLLVDLDPESREGAQLLAASGPLPAAEAEAQLGGQRLSRLFSLGLARYVSYGAVNLVSIFPPILADYLNTQNPWRSAPPIAGTPADQPTAGLLSVGAAAIVGSRMAREAEARARARQADWAANPCPATAMPLLLALESAMAPDEELDRVIAQTPLTGADADTAAYLTMRATWLANRHGDLPGALAELAAARSRMPAHEATLRASEAYLRLNHAELPSAELLAPAVPNAAEPYGADALTSVRTAVLLAQGRTSSAAELLASYAPANPMLKAYGDAWRDLGLVLAGDIDRGVQQALLHLEEGRQELSLECVEAFGYTGLLGLTLAGRMLDATRLLDDLLATFPSQAVRSNYREAILTLGGLLAQWQGRTAHARALATQSQERAPHEVSGPFPGMVPGMVELVVRSAVTGADIADPLWQQVEEQADAGFIVTALLSGLVAVEYGPREATGAKLCELAAATESPLMQALGRYIAAAARLDTAAIEASVAEFVELGALMAALQGSIFSAHVLRQQGRLEASAELAGRAWELAAAAGPERWGLFGRLSLAVGLSRREFAVLELLSGGLPTPEVATALGMSSRTVETHLHNISRKVGLSGKENLVYAAQTWLRPPA